jgi:hypothetical protein
MMFNDENEEMMPLEELRQYRRTFWSRVAAVFMVLGVLVVLYKVLM